MKAGTGHSGALLSLLVLLVAASVHAAERKVLPGHVPQLAERWQAVERVPGTQPMDLAIGLPLRHREALTNLLRDIYDPASAQYRRYLTPEQFTARFGPSPEDYQAVRAYAERHGLLVTGTHSNRMLLDVRGAAADVERAFRVTLRVYRDPAEKRPCYAPEQEPSVEPELPVLDISGLDDAGELHPMSLEMTPLTAGSRMTAYGSGEDGTYLPGDIRAAYAPGVTLDGAGEAVGLVEFDGFYATDITEYAATTGLPNVPLRKVLVAGASGAPGKQNIEVALDIEMTMAMAPGLKEIIVYEAPNNIKYINDLLNRMATDNLARQLSSSWGSRPGPSATTDQIFQQMAAQGQSFFQASGDGGAYVGAIAQPSDNPYITVVGGTSLEPGWFGGWGSESVWNAGASHGSGGGISTFYPLPDWQQGLDVSASQGSTAMRNTPDVAFLADNVFAVVSKGKHARCRGTSVSAPLWAGFAALANQQTASHNLPAIGFLNPALYALGRGPHYATDFHDVVAGNNATDKSPQQFFAVPGYDLCTGWGTPAGQALIDDLSWGRAGLGITPADDVTINGPAGGPFTNCTATFTLADTGWIPLNWSLSNTSAWLTVSVASGALCPDGPNTLVTVSLNAAAEGLAPGTYSTTLLFTNSSDDTVQSRQVTLQAIATGTLSVQLGLQEAVAAGARWQVDGGPWQESGAILRLPTGLHTITFSDVTGWFTPMAQSINIEFGQTTTATAVYDGQGALQVILGPAEAVAAGAAWRFDTDPWWWWPRHSGDTVSRLREGTYTLIFTSGTGWTTPAQLSVAVHTGQTTVTNIAFSAITGALVVAIYPDDAVAAGAKWQVDGGPWHQSEETVTGLIIGQHTVTFSTLTDRPTPSPRSVTISQSYTPRVSGVYPDAYYFTRLSIQANPPLSSPDGLALDSSGNIYVAERGNHVIRRLTPDGTNWVAAILAGSPGAFGSADGIGDQARFYWPSGIAVDGSGKIYVADSGNHAIRRLTQSGDHWVVTTIAGNAGWAGNNDGLTPNVSFYSPASVTIDGAGNLFVVNTGTASVRELVAAGTNWLVSTVAGMPWWYGFMDGTGSSAVFNVPLGVAVDGGGRLFIADSGNQVVRMATPTGSGQYFVQTIAGNRASGSDDGPLGCASFIQPRGVAIGKCGDVFVTDAIGAIRRLTPFVGLSWLVSTVGGIGSAWGNADGLGGAARFSGPSGIAVDAAGRLWISDVNNNTIRLGVPVAVGVLLVTLNPGEAVAGGAHWQVDGGAWQDSNASVVLPVGPHLVTFSAVSGWTGPESMSVTVNSNATTAVTAAYTPQSGSLQVNLGPAEAASAGARWRVDGGAWEESGVTIAGLGLGNHVIEFASITGWTAPSQQTVVISADQLSTATGTYQQYGSLQVSLAPPRAISAGARWQVDGSDWQESGAVVEGLALGNHVVAFSLIDGWAAPESQKISIGANQLTTATGTYQEYGSLQVLLLPSEAASAGACWQVDGGDWQANGAVATGLATGQHTVSFATIDGWTAPPAQTVNISLNQATTVSGIYTQEYGCLQVTLQPAAAVKAGAKWQVDNGACQASGAVVSGLAGGEHTVTFSPVAGWNAPSYRSVQIGQDTTNSFIAAYLPFDSTPPRISINTPTNRMWNFPFLTASGTAQDNGTVAQVWYQLNTDPWTIANGTTNWAASLLLKLGTNTLRVYAVDAGGNASPISTFNATYGLASRLFLTINGGGTVSPAYDGQWLPLGRSCTFTAKAAPGYVFSNWTGSVVCETPTVTFTMRTNFVLQANFVPNPFPPLAGNYQGLFYDTRGPATASSGSFNATVTAAGAYTAGLVSGGNRYTVSGQLSAGGFSSNSIARKSANALGIELRLDVRDGETMRGRLIDSGWTAELTAFRAVWSRKNPAPQATRYTLVIPGSEDAIGQPGGDGFGTLTVDASGNVAFSGSLADGTAVTQTAALSRQGHWPLYVASNSGGGSLIGWLELGGSPGPIQGPLQWIKPPKLGAKLYPAGFTNVTVAAGSVYRYGKGARVLDGSAGELRVTGGNLLSDFTNQIVLGADGRLTNLSPNRLTFTLTTASGSFKGSVVHPQTGQNISFSGVVVQGQNAGHGFFLGTNQSGRVLFNVAPQ